ncbi:GAF domain-containing protein [Oscillatoria sp. FACHB-1407]|uniref:GAF domain-containing protein n=1 Tax=Oscillatoria sp. FACHB-1407 TaxID=2692847 RepID=UPI0016893F06|nr:GAF domain-containing protein [Oscillatoria sp. FACHB-1407]MBD2461385.1 GAF domain-containing protein [Oscillatoria sp. FACHB-1407]
MVNQLRTNALNELNHIPPLSEEYAAEHVQLNATKGPEKVPGSNKAPVITSDSKSENGSADWKNTVDIRQATSALIAIKAELEKTGALENPEMREKIQHLLNVVRGAHQDVKGQTTDTVQQQFKLNRQQVEAIAQQLHQAAEPETLFSIAAHKIREILEVDRTLIYRFDTVDQGSVLAEALVDGWTPMLGEMLKAHCFGLGKASDYERQLVAIEDVYQRSFSPYQMQLFERFQTKASFAIPVVLNKQMWGLLVVQQCHKPRRWQEAEITLLQQVVAELVAILQQLEFHHLLKQQLEQEQAILRVTEKIRQAKDAFTILRAATQDIRYALKCDRAVVYRFNPDWSGEFIAESVGSGWVSVLEEQKHEALLQGNRTESDRCVLRNWGEFGALDQDTYLKQTQGGKYMMGEKFTRINDVSKAGFSPCYLESLAKYQAKAYLIVPIFHNGNLWGLLGVYQNSGPRHWLEYETNLLLQVGGAIEVALQRVDYIKSIEREQAIAKVINKIRRPDDVEGVFQVAVQEIRQLLACDRAVVYRFNPDWSGEFVAESVGNGWPSMLQQQDNSPTLRDNISECSAELPKTLPYNDTYLQANKGGLFNQVGVFRVEEDIYTAGFSPCYIEALENYRIRAYVIVAIYAGQKLWGLLAAYQNGAPRRWQDADKNLLVQISTQVGLALQQAEFVAQLQEKSTQLIKEAEQERAVAKVIDRIRKTLDLDSIFNTTVQEARRFLKVERLTIYKFRPNFYGDFLVEAGAADLNRLVGSGWEDPYLSEHQGGRFRMNEPYIVNDVYAADITDCHLEALENFGVRACLVVSIFRGKELWGLLSAFQHSAPRHWEEGDVQFLTQIAAQLGIALQQAEYLQQIQTQSQQLSEAAEREKTAKEKLQQDVIQLLSSVRPVLQGDLTVRAIVTEDEVGTVADAYNNTIQSLRRIVTQVQSSAAKVGQTSTESGKAIAALSEQAKQEAQEITSALTQIEAMVNATQTVAANTHQMETAVQQANQTVQQGDAAMNRSVNGILAIRETVSEATKKIKRLSESSQKISKVVNLINNFTTQTQLLALNAAIEATRAGEYGRGFAVVADEVRSLAQQSAEATTEIEKLVQEIQAETSAVATAMDTGIQQVVSGTNLVTETRQSLNAIVTATGQISELLQGITQSTQAQIQQSQTVIQTMQNVVAIANKTSTDSVQISTSFQDLLTTAQELQASVGQFKVS